MNTQIADAVADAMNDLINMGDDKTPAPKGKAKRQTKVKTAEEMKAAVKEPKAQPEAQPEAKPEPAMWEGFELAAGTDPSAAEDAAKRAEEAASLIARKDGDLLPAYLTIGEVSSGLKAIFASTKLHGKFLAEKVPSSQSLDPALRSNCKWLWEALNVPDADGHDILSVLGINRIEDFKSKNPTVIKREYKSAVSAAAAMAAAEADGMTVEQKAEKDKADAAAAAEALMKAFEEAAETLKVEAAGQKTREAVADFLADAFVTAIKSGPKQSDAIAYIASAYGKPSEE